MPESKPEQAALKGNAAQLAKILEVSDAGKPGEDMPEASAKTTPVPPDPAELAGQFPQLEIIELLGAGGMGLVYRARQPRLDRIVALKILAVDAGGDSTFAERFSREARALAKLNHPGIVAIYDFGQTTRNYYFIMEYVEGMNLRQLLKSQSILPRHSLELVTQICTALQYAHDEGIVHRDIKPENILINKRGQAKIADFGLAKLLNRTSDATLTASHLVMGSVNYMAPEQQEKPLTVDHRADIYSLGVVLYEMLTGELPIGRFAPPSKKIQVDVRLDEVVLRALEKDPDLRYQKASDQKTAIEAVTKTLETAATDRPEPPEMKKARAAWPLALAAVIVLTFAGWWFGSKRPTVQTSNTTALPAVELNQDESWAFTTIAGQAGSRGATDGIGSDARFNMGEHRASIALDEFGNLYVSEAYNNTIRLLTPSGAVSTLAGLAGTAGNSDGLGADARFRSPHGIALDRSGNAYVADCGNHTIRRITPSGMVTIFAGQPGVGGSADGPAAIARFNEPDSIAAGPDGSIFVADWANNTVRRITPAGLVSTVAGQAGVKGSTDGLGPSARFNGLNDVTVGARGFLYVTDRGNNTIRVINPSGVVRTLAGQSGVAGSTDGATTNARFNYPCGIRVDAEGNLYVADTGNSTIRKITSAGVVTTIGGFAGKSGSRDGAGANARFNQPSHLALDTQGNIYITDAGNNTIRKGHLRAAANNDLKPGMALIPAGSFTMGDTLDGETDAVPVEVTVSAFYMDVNLVSYSQWQSVYSWAANQGYDFVNVGAGKAANHPVQTVDWYDAVKWSNARSQQAGLTPVYYTDEGLTRVYTNGEVGPYVNWSADGYRLPTEAEWEKAARGGLSGRRFPWGNTISESQANYSGNTSFSYDMGPDGVNGAFTTRQKPYTSPVGSFATNGYGLHDMAGNVQEWCWDWYGTPYAGGSDPHGPGTGNARVLRGGRWNYYASAARCADRAHWNPNYEWPGYGFRCVSASENAATANRPGFGAKLDTAVSTVTEGEKKDSQNKFPVLYQTQFEPPTFQPGNLVKQDGWFAEGGHSPNAAKIVSPAAAQHLLISGPDIQMVQNGNRYVAFFSRHIYYDPALTGTTLVSVSTDLQLDVGPKSSISKYFFAFMVMNDKNGKAFECVGFGARGDVFAQNWAESNQVVGAHANGANAVHNLRVDLDFENRQATYFMDGQVFGITAFNPKSGNVLDSVRFSLESGDAIDSTLSINSLSIKVIPNQKYKHGIQQDKR